MKKMSLISMVLVLVVLLLAGCSQTKETPVDVPVNEEVNIENSNEVVENEVLENEVNIENSNEVVENEVVETEEDTSYLSSEDDKFKTYTIIETDTNTGGFNPLSVINPDVTLENMEEKCASALGNIGLNKVFENDLISIVTVATNLDSKPGEIPIIVTNKTSHDIYVSPVSFSWKEDTIFVNDIPCDFSAFIEVPANGVAEDVICYDEFVILLNNISSVQSFKINLEIAYDDDSVGEPVETGLFEIRTKDYSKVDDEVQYVGRKIETKTEGLSIYDAGWVGYSQKSGNMADKVLIVENNTDYNVAISSSSYRIEEIAEEKGRDLYYRPGVDKYFLPNTVGAITGAYSNEMSAHDVYPDDNLVVCDLVFDIVVRNTNGELVDNYEIIYEDSLDWNKVEILY